MNPNSKRLREEESFASFEKSLGINLRKKKKRESKRQKEEEFKRRNCRYWSELPPDLIHSVFERLSFGDIRRVKSVCSAWHSASRKCTPKHQIPWLILFPEDDNDNRCKLFNPEEKDKIYTSQDLGVGFAESVCVATHGCCLLMRNPLFNLYIVNLLTGQRINLPPVESQLGHTKLERIVDDKFRATLENWTVYLQADSTGFEIVSPRLWVDEETKDYLVLFSFRIYSLSFRTQYAIICKKGDPLWRQIPDCSACPDIVYKHQKLYVYCDGYIRILDFSGELLGKSYVYPAIFFLDLYHFPSETRLFIVEKTNIVVTISGDVLMVASVMASCGTWSFCVYKMTSSTNRWEKLVSLCEEAILLDLGITVLAKQIEGIRKNSIYFSGLGKDGSDIFIFDLKKNKIERPHRFVRSSLQYSHARWFFPGFTRKQDRT